MFNVMCEVSGGITGYRSSLLRNDDGVVVFETRQEAEDKAKELRRSMNTSYTGPRFNYTAVEA